MCFAKSTASESTKYDGPVIEGTQLEIIRSDDGVVIISILTDKFLQYQNGDRMYPEGIYGTFYDTDKSISAILSANTVYYYAEKDVYELKGAVEIKSYKGKKQLNTEELHWNIGTEEIYTDKFVRVATEEELLTGKGLTARQDLSRYSLLVPEGFASVEAAE